VGEEGKGAITIKNPPFKPARRQDDCRSSCYWKPMLPSYSCHGRVQEAKHEAWSHQLSFPNPNKHWLYTPCRTFL